MYVNALNRSQLLHLPILEKRIGAAVAFLRQNNIESILIKGWAAAQFYPNITDRQFGDVDLAVSAAQYDVAVKVLDSYKDKKLIDLHKSIRHLDTLSFEDLYSNSKLIKCYDTEIRILRPEDHLRILCVHWLTDGGEYKNRLWDIYYAVENRPPDFDWDRCLNTVSETRRRWIVCTIGLAHKYLGLNVADTPIASEVAKIPGWVVKSLEREWNSGVRLLSLHFFINDRKMFWQQIKKRIPPNPIQSTINMEGEFNNAPRLIYQIPDMFIRLKPSLKRILQTISSLSARDNSKGNK
jgi:hypothetical protein